MADTQYFKPRSCTYEWRQDFFDNNRLPASDRVSCFTMQDFRPVMDFINRGVSAIQVSNGEGNDLLDPIVPWQNRWVLTGRGWMGDPLAYKPFPSWTLADVTTVTNYWFNIRQVKYITSDMDEGPYNSNTAHVEENESAWVELNKQMGAKAAARGQFWLGQYSGSVYAPPQSTSALRSVLAGGASALSWLKGAGVYSICPYWKHDLYNFNNGTILNAYFRGPQNLETRTTELLAQFAIGRLAMDQTGANQPIMVYTEGVDNEINIGTGTVGHSGYYPRQMANGGKTVGVSWPNVPLEYTIWEGFMIRLFKYMDCIFKPIEMFGSNPNVIRYNSNTHPLFNFYSEGSNNNPTRANSVGIRAAPGTVVPYPPHPIGYENGHMVSDLFYEVAIQHVGNSDWNFPTITPEGGSTVTPGGGKYTFIADMQESRLPRAVYGQNSGNKRWIMIFDPGRADGTILGNRRTCLYAMNGVNKSITTVGGTFSFWTFD